MASNFITVTKQIVLVLVAAGILWALLACGPAAPADQGGLGGVTVSPQGETPTEAPHPTPLPTTCITGEGAEGQPEEDCYTPEPRQPDKYTKLHRELDLMVQDAEAEREAQGDGARGTSDEDSKLVKVVITVDEMSDTAGAKVAVWLKEQGITYRERKDDNNVTRQIGAYVPVSKLAPLSQLETVQRVYPPAVPVIPAGEE